MSRLGDVDRTLLALVSLALLAGIIVLYSASAQVGAGPGAGLGAGFVLRRLAQLGIGIALMGALALADYRWLRRLVWPAALLALLLLGWVLATKSVRGTRGWLPVFGHSFQPLDVARVCLIPLMAHLLARREGERGFLRRFGPPLLALGVACGLVVAQPDYGSALALGLTGALLLLSARPPVRWVLAGLLALSLLTGAGYLSSGRIRERVDLVLRFDPESEAAGAYQLRQSLIGLGAGGVMGQGAGLNRQKSFLPDHHTDFIFAIVGEEYGLVGTVALLALLTAIVLRILRLAGRQRDPYARYLAIGVGSMLFVYTTMNVAVAVGLFPLTGVPLPFVSHGGSALVMNLGALGLVLALGRERGRHARRADGRGREVSPLAEDLFGGGYEP